MSARQLAVAAFTGLLAPAAAMVGADWRGGLFAIPVVMAVSLSWGVLGSGEGGWTGKWEKGERIVFSIIYIVWLVALAGTILAAAGERITAPDENGAGWAVALIWVPVILLAQKEPAVLGRTAEIFYFAMVAALVVILLFGAAQIRVERLLAWRGGFLKAVLAAAGTGCAGVFALLLWEGDENVGKPKWAAWSGALMTAQFFVHVVTIGVLGGVLTAERERPFFTMTVGLGETARIESLVSAVWMIADVVLAGLLAQCGRRLWRVMGLKKEKIGIWTIALAILGFGLWIRGEGNVAAMQDKVLPALDLEGGKCG